MLTWFLKCVTAGFSFLAAFFSCMWAVLWILPLTGWNYICLQFQRLCAGSLCRVNLSQSSPSAPPLPLHHLCVFMASFFMETLPVLFAANSPAAFIFKAVSSEERKFSWRMVVVLAQLWLCFSPLLSVMLNSWNQTPSRLGTGKPWAD